MSERPRDDDDRILRHKRTTPGFVAAGRPDPDCREALDAHLSQHLGECDTVWHEIVSDLVHLDVYMWRPTKSRPMFTFVTVGASDRRMTLPKAAVRQGCASRIEL